MNMVFHNSSSFLSQVMVIISNLCCCFSNVADIDYIEVATEAQFAPFEQLSCVNVSIIDNSIVGKEGTKNFSVHLYSDLTNVFVVESGASAEVSILENDGKD